MPKNKYRKNNRFTEEACIYITIDSTDDEGQLCIARDLVLRCPCMIVNRRVSDVVGGDSFEPEAAASTRITIRHDFSTNIQFNTKMIICIRGIFYSIVGIFEDEMNRVVKFDVARASNENY